MFYRVFRAAANITLRLFFRRIEVEGDQMLPTGPVLLVSNHTNALVDPLLPLIVLKRHLTLTGKNVLKKNPLLALLTWGLGSISFHRVEDAHKGANPRENVRSMQRCREVLAGGGAISLFPEGISHSDLTMRPFHVGAARLALDYIRKNDNAGGLMIVPVGILYTAKDQFRSEVWLRFGPAIDAGQWATEHPHANADALTQEIRRRIEALTIGYQNRREMLIVNWANDVVATQAQIPRMLGSTEPSVAESFERLTRLQSGYRTLAQSHGPQISELSDRVRQYRSELKRRGIEPTEVYLPIHPLRAMFFLLRELELIVVGAPLALFGIINHLLPYLLVRLIARRLSVDKDHWATNVIYPSMIVFPLFYCLQIGAAFLLLPVFWAALYTIALPYTGYYAILYSERAGGAWRRAATFVYFCLRPELHRSLVSQGRHIFADISALAGQLQHQDNRT
jgi:glycerol-3-phosphate O-acyltransferase/dihydroxyacetone phosphate acyltransferase